MGCNRLTTGGHTIFSVGINRVEHTVQKPSSLLLFFAWFPSSAFLEGNSSTLYSALPTVYIILLQYLRLDCLSRQTRRERQKKFGSSAAGFAR